MSSFSVGDVVELKSGGPKMTVSAVIGTPENSRALEIAATQRGLRAGDVYCTWFDKNEKKIDGFQAMILKKSQ